jgi:hypothetical protein
MALTVSGLNLTVMDACDSTNDWSGSPNTDTDTYMENGTSLSWTLKSSGNNDVTYTLPSGTLDLSGTKHVRWWGLYTQGSLINTLAAGGIQFFCSDGTNTGYWYVGGKDTYPGGWFNFVIDVSQAVDAGTKPTSMNAITSWGFRINLTGTGKNVDNSWFDNVTVCDGLIAYGKHDTGSITAGANVAGTYTRSAGSFLTDGFKTNMTIDITGYSNSGNNGRKVISTVTATVITVTDATGMVTESGTGDEDFEGFFDIDDVYEKDANTTTGLGIGIIRKIGGVYFFTGAVRIGDSAGSSDTKFQDKSTAWVFEDRDVSSTLYDIDVVDNGTGTTEFFFGKKVGTSGVEGIFLRTEDATQTPKFTLDAKTDTDVNNFYLYGTTFFDASTIDLPLTAATVETRNCSFERCGVVTPQTSKVEYCNFITADTDAMTISSTTLNVKYCNFINPTDNAIQVTSAGTYAFYDMVFSGTGASGPYDIENTIAGTVTIQNNGTSNAQYANNPGSGTTNFESTKTLTLTNVVVGSRCYIEQDPRVSYTSHASNNAQGDSTFETTATIAADHPAEGWIIIFDDSDNGQHHMIRFDSWTGTTVTFPTKITASTDDAGGATEIRDTDGDFGNKDIEYGDIVRNATDGSWAQVVSITSTVVTTTPLKGGTENDWDSGDTYEFHTLPVTYGSSDTCFIPWMNEKATASTVVATINYQSTKTIRGTVRYVDGALPYRDVDFSGSFGTSGYTRRIDQVEDPQL